jgi:hypothetical protein
MAPALSGGGSLRSDGDACQAVKMVWCLGLGAWANLLRSRLRRSMPTVFPSSSYVSCRPWLPRVYRTIRRSELETKANASGSGDEEALCSTKSSQRTRWSQINSLLDDSSALQWMRMFECLGSKQLKMKEGSSKRESWEKSTG